MNTTHNEDLDRARREVMDNDSSPKYEAPAGALWLLTVNYDYDDDADNYMMERQSLHASKKAAVLRLFDVVYEVTSATPQETIENASSTREDGAQFGDLDAMGVQVSYSLVPLVVQDER